MARSTYIYLVYDDHQGEMLGAFTVKHEAKAFIKNLDKTDRTISIDSWIDGFQTKQCKTWEEDEFMA